MKCENVNELMKEYESRSKKLDSLTERLFKVQKTIKDLNEEILVTLKIVKYFRDDNNELFEELEEFVKNGSTVYPNFKDLENSRDKAHIKRCIEVTETKLRRLRGEL